MAKNLKNFRNLAIAGAFMSAFIAANDVGAQTTNRTFQSVEEVIAANGSLTLLPTQCATMAVTNQVMIANGQRTLIIGDRVGVNHSDTSSTGLVLNKWMNAVASNADGSIGYLLEGDKSSTEPSTQACVKLKLTNIQLFDASKKEIPQAALLGGAFNRAMQLSAEDGIRPMVVADTVFGQGANLRSGAPMVLIGNPVRKIGSITTMQQNGEAVSMTQMQNLEYTQLARQKFASNSTPVTLAGLNK